MQLVRAYHSLPAGLLDVATGGVVAFTDTDTKESAARELEEEMGITGVALRHVVDGPFEDSVTRLWGSVFVCSYSGPVVPQESEVADVVMLTHSAVEALTPAEATPDSLHFYRVWRALDHVAARQQARWTTVGLGVLVAVSLTVLGAVRSKR